MLREINDGVTIEAGDIIRFLLFLRPHETYFLVNSTYVGVGYLRCPEQGKNISRSWEFMKKPPCIFFKLDLLVDRVDKKKLLWPRVVGVV